MRRFPVHSTYKFTNAREIIFIYVLKAKQVKNPKKNYRDTQNLTQTDTHNIPHTTFRGRHSTTTTTTLRNNKDEYVHQ